MEVNAFGKVSFKTVGKAQTIVFINHNGYPQSLWSFQVIAIDCQLKKIVARTPQNLFNEISQGENSSRAPITELTVIHQSSF